jgi:hypothetical protein
MRLIEWIVNWYYRIKSEKHEALKRYISDLERERSFALINKHPLIKIICLDVQIHKAKKRLERKI